MRHSEKGYIMSGSYMVHSIGGIDMREIKFRAWDKKTKKMRTVESIGFGELSYYNEGYPVVNMIGRDCINDKDIIIHRDSYQHELMQYTGLKDKNGKEIYEGDILLYNNDIKTVVNYKNGAFVRSYENSNVYLLYDSFIADGCLDDYEVIGNIYKDKHLLEEEI